MGYKEVKDQTGVEKGYVRFEFYIRFNGERYRKVITCRRSVVNHLFRDWEDSIVTGGVKEYKLFEIMDMYLNFVDAGYSGRMVKYTHTIFDYFRKCFKNLSLSDFRRSHVQDYIVWRKSQRKKRGGDPISDRTINREIAELSKLFTWAIEREIYFKVNPCFRQRVKVNIQREVYLTPEQIEELLQAAQREGELIFSAVLIALSTGFRRGEIFDLQYKDIDSRHSRIFLRASTTKGNKGRIVAVPDYLVEHFEEMRVKAKDKDGRVFQDWPSVEWFRNSFERVRNQLSFNPLPNGSNIHIHDLRHIYAQCLRDQGVALQDIQAFLGHSSVTVTERFYAQAGGKDAKQKVERLAEIIPLRKSS